MMAGLGGLARFFAAQIDLWLVLETPPAKLLESSA
jgi:hypothetical protein